MDQARNFKNPKMINWETEIVDHLTIRDVFNALYASNQLLIRLQELANSSVSSGGWQPYLPKRKPKRHSSKRFNLGNTLKQFFTSIAGVLFR